MVSILGASLPLTGLGGGRRADADPAARERRRAMDLLLRTPEADPEILVVVAEDGTAIHTEARGPADGIPIVFSHGWSCQSRVWNAQINELARDHRVIVYDQRGHGRTASGPGEASIEVLGRDLAAVVRVATGGGPEAGGRRAVLVGHSMGGMTISAWAGLDREAMAEQCRGAILASTATDRLLQDFGVLPFPTRLPGAFAIGKAALSTPLASGALPSGLFQYLTMGASATRAQVAFSRDIVNSCSARNRGRWGAALSEVDISAGLASIPVPTTVIVGAADRLTPPVHSERMAQVLDGNGVLAGHVVLAGVGHMSPVEAPFEFNAEVRRLVAMTS